jgi:hypothetical protein
MILDCREQARTLLASTDTSLVSGATRRGRPKQSTASPALFTPAKKKRKLSPEGWARIAEAAKRRRAKQKAGKNAKA